MDPAMASLERSLGEACDRLDALYRVRQRSARVLKPGTRWEEDCGNVIGRVAALVARGEAAEREQVFDLFAERRVLQVIAALGREGPVSVKQRVLRACALLAQNIRRQQALYLLLSSPAIDAILRDAPAFLDDDETRCVFVALLKTLSVRLDATTVQFFVSDDRAFPLHDAAVGALEKIGEEPFGTPERAGCLATLLHCWGVDDANARRACAGRAPDALNAVGRALARAFHAAVDALDDAYLLQGGAAEIEDLATFLRDAAASNTPAASHAAHDTASAVAAFLAATVVGGPAPPERTLGAVAWIRVATASQVAKNATAETVLRAVPGALVAGDSGAALAAALACRDAALATPPDGLMTALTTRAFAADTPPALRAACASAAAALAGATEGGDENARGALLGRVDLVLRGGGADEDGALAAWAAVEVAAAFAAINGVVPPPAPQPPG